MKSSDRPKSDVRGRWAKDAPNLPVKVLHPNTQKNMSKSSTKKVAAYDLNTDITQRAFGSEHNDRVASFNALMTIPSFHNNS